MVNTNITRGRLSIWELGGGVLLKPLVEAATKPLIGDATLMSGAVKGIAAIASCELVGKKYPTIGNIFGIAFGMDAAEDLFHAFGIIPKVQAMIPSNNGGLF